MFAGNDVSQPAEDKYCDDDAGNGETDGHAYGLFLRRSEVSFGQNIGDTRE